MESILPSVLAIVAVILTIVLSVVGVQIIMVLMEIKRILKKANDTIDQAEAKFHAVIAPLENLGGIASGLKQGVKVFESFTGWLHKDADEEE